MSKTVLRFIGFVYKKRKFDDVFRSIFFVKRCKPQERQEERGFSDGSVQIRT